MCSFRQGQLGRFVRRRRGVKLVLDVLELCADRCPWFEDVPSPGRATLGLVIELIEFRLALGQFCFTFGQTFLKLSSG